MSSPQITKAVLIPMNGDQPAPVAQHIPVQFNPNSLRVTLSNTLRAENAGGNNASAAQYIDKSESSLSIQLLFDTTVPGIVSRQVIDPGANATTRTQSTASASEQGQAANASNHQANSDVRLLTQKIADTFMKPQEANPERPSAPKRCRFQWGSFVFVGMVSSYNETLDFFSPEGVPLRSTLALTLKEDKYQYEFGKASIGQRAQPEFSPGGEAQSTEQVARNEGKDPRAWRDIAMFNGIENPRLTARFGVAVPNVSLAKIGTRVGAPEVGFSVGSSVTLGSGIPGAFKL